MDSPKKNLFGINDEDTFDPDNISEHTIHDEVWNSTQPLDLDKLDTQKQQVENISDSIMVPKISDTPQQISEQSCPLPESHDNDEISLIIN